MTAETMADEVCDTCGHEATSWWSAGSRMLFACRDCASDTDDWARFFSAYPDGPHPIERNEEADDDE